MVESDGGAVTLSCCVERGALKMIRARYPASGAGNAVLQHIRANCHGVAEVLRRASVEGNWLAAGPIRPGIRRQFEGGVFFVGNVAGEAHPIIAEGISMAMQGAWLLARELTADAEAMFRGARHVEAGRAYSREWRRHFSPRLRVAAALARVALSTRATNSMLPLARRFPKLLTLGAQLAGKARNLAPARSPILG